MPNSLGCDLFIGKARNVCTLTGVLDRNAADIAALVEIQNSVLVQILRLGDFRCLELDIECVRVLEISNLHTRNKVFSFLNASLVTADGSLQISLVSRAFQSRLLI